ncbi:MAG: DinB family protein [Spirochaetia bacterium]|nr:DinB family protein [Spirochaetia bacterium]
MSQMTHVNTDSLADILKASLAFRKVLVKKLEDVPETAWDLVPEGQNNNIRWQCAHLSVTPGLLTYVRLGKEIPILSPAFVASAKKGTNPSSFDAKEDFSKARLLDLLVRIIDRLGADAAELAKIPFSPYETSTGLVLESLTGAFAYSSVHDGLHIGTIHAMLRQLKF